MQKAIHEWVSQYGYQLTNETTPANVIQLPAFVTSPFKYFRAEKSPAVPSIVESEVAPEYLLLKCSDQSFNAQRLTAEFSLLQTLNSEFPESFLQPHIS